MLDLLEQRMDWRRPFDRGSGIIRRGRGVAIGLKACISPTTSVAIVLIYGDGSCALQCGTVDMGQASDTALAQIVAEVLGIPTDVRARRPPGYGRHAVRHGDARIAVDVPHGQRRAGGCRGRARPGAADRRPRSLGADLSELECVDAEVVSSRGSAHDAARDHARPFRDAGRHHRRRRIVHAVLQEAGSRRPASRPT